MGCLLRVLALVSVLSFALPVSEAAAQDPGFSCGGVTEGGEWRSYGGGLDNARNQAEEGVIGPAEAGSLAPKWMYNIDAAIPADSTTGRPGGGAFSNTPVVADGCAYLASNTGWVVALNADLGTELWRSFVRGRGQTLLGGVIVGSPVVGDGVVYVGVSLAGSPYLAALDQQTGALLWQSVVDTIESSGINASPVLFEMDGRPMVFQGFFGNEGTELARGGYAIIDASPSCDGCPLNEDGVPQKPHLAKEYTINDRDYEAGYRGASVWTTGAVDTDTGHIYVGGGNPASKKLEHAHSNALLKIDVDPSRASFGQIVDAYKGDVDQYVPGLERQPLCDELGEDVVYVAWSLTCLQLDLDFGASPNLYTDHLGRKIVGALQKSGVYHAVYADGMKRAWTSIVGAPCFACNASSSSFDDDSIYIASTPVGQMVALDRTDGRHQWASPIGDGIHFQSVSSANGVVYGIDGHGSLRGFDAATGVPVLVRPFTMDAGEPVSDLGNSAGVAIARNTVYAAASSYVVAYGSQGG